MSSASLPSLIPAPSSFESGSSSSAMEPSQAQQISSSSSYLFKFCPFWMVYEQPQFDRDSISWEDLCVAGDTLEPVVGADGGWTLSLKKRGELHSSAYTPTTRRSRTLLFSALRRRPRVSLRPEGYTSKITAADLDCFSLFVEKVRYDMAFYEIFTSATLGDIEHDSSVDSVVERLPNDMIEAIPELRTRIEGLIDFAHEWQVIDSYYQYAFFLPTCPVIEVTASASDNWKKLKEVDEFGDRFGSVSDQMLIYMLNVYLDYMIIGVESETFFRSDIEWEYEKHKRDYLQRREKFLRGAWCPIHFLVDQERNMGYRIRHSLVEYAKVRAFFYPFDIESKLKTWITQMKIWIPRKLKTCSSVETGSEPNKTRPPLCPSISRTSICDSSPPSDT